MLNPLLSLQHLGWQKSKKSTCWDARRVTRVHLSRLGLPCLVYQELLPQLTLGTKFQLRGFLLLKWKKEKKRGLCYNCDDIWVPGHKCKNVTLFLLEGVEMDQDSSCGVQLTEIEDGVTIARVQEEEVEAEITLYALVGSPTPGTMRVKGRIITISLVILVDSRSTNNFIDASLILGLQIPVDVS